MCTIQTPKGKIEYLFYRSARRRSIAISVDAHAAICVAAPTYVNEKEVRGFILEKASWIQSRVEEARKKRSKIDERKFEDGHAFLFLGKKYKISIETVDVFRSRFSFDGFKFVVQLSKAFNAKERQQVVKEKLIKWYRKQGEEILGGRIFHYARAMGEEPNKIMVKTQKRIWGCCDYGQKSIHLNWQVIMAPLPVIDYVVVHELAHLKHPNHGVRFWKKVEKFMPRFKEYKKWLRDHQSEMSLCE